MERRKAWREACEKNGRIVVFGDQVATHPCRILDLTSFGALIQLDRDASVPRQFELMIGDSPLTYPSRLARVSSRGIGIEFLDPLRDEIAQALAETLFQDDLLIERAEGIPAWRSPIRRKLNKAVERVMQRLAFPVPQKNRQHQD